MAFAISDSVAIDFMFKRSIGVSIDAWSVMPGGLLACASVPIICLPISQCI